MPFTVPTANMIINKLLNNIDFSSPSKLYVSLHIADPGDTGENEVTGGGYKRQQVFFDTANNKKTSNINDIVFENMPTCFITHMGLWDAEIGGNFWLGTALTEQKQLYNGDIAKFNAGDIIVELE